MIVSSEKTARRMMVERLSSSMKAAASLVVALAATRAAAQLPTPVPPQVREPLARYGDAVIAALRSRDLAALEARFDDNLRRVQPPDRLGETLDNVTAQIGALHECDAPTVTLREPVTVVEYRCRLDRGPFIVRLSWNAQFELAGFFFLPPPPPKEAPPANAREEAVTVGANGWPLPGTLLIPGGVARPPVAVLVQGSGPNDRDESIGPNHVFLDLANGLARAGIATLRYDKRTRVFGERFASELKNFTLDDEIVDDAVAALVAVSRRGDLGPVFVIGHSEGAWLAPRIARRAREEGVPIAGVVMLAANASPLADVIVHQFGIAAAASPPRATQEMVDEVREERDNVARLVATGHVERGHEALPFDMPASAWLDIARYDAPAALLAQTGLPALLVFGARDFQVQPSRSGAVAIARRVAPGDVHRRVAASQPSADRRRRAARAGGIRTSGSRVADRHRPHRGLDRRSDPASLTGARRGNTPPNRPALRYTDSLRRVGTIDAFATGSAETPLLPWPSPPAAPSASSIAARSSR